MDKRELKRYPTCPECGSDEFTIQGLVGYKQPYKARFDEYGTSEIEWDVDFPQKALCRSCDYDATDLFMERNVLAFYGDPILE